MKCYKNEREMESENVCPLIKGTTLWMRKLGNLMKNGAQNNAERTKPLSWIEMNVNKCRQVLNYILKIILAMCMNSA